MLDFFLVLSQDAVNISRFVWNYLDSLPIKRIHDRWIEEYAIYAVGVLEGLKRSLETQEPAEDL